LLVLYEAYQNALGLRSFGCFSNIDKFIGLDENDDGGDAEGEGDGEEDENDLAVLPSSVINPLEASKSYLALGSYDGKIRIMTMYTWIIAYELPLVHPRELNPAMIEEGFKTKVEISSHDFLGIGKNLNQGLFEGTSTATGNRAEDGTIFTRMESLGGSKTEKDKNAPSSLYVEKMIKILPKNPIDSRGSAKSPHALPAVGVSWLGWSSDGKYLAATEESQPRCLWIWEPNNSKLVDLIIQLDPITTCQWRPNKPTTLSSSKISSSSSSSTSTAVRSAENILTFCCGTNAIYIWCDNRGVMKQENVFNGNEQNSFNIHSLKWNAESSKLLVKGKESYAICNMKL
jgi:hypothetical protein